MVHEQFPMRLVARLTGLTPHVIRVWEHRYRAVEPARTPTNRRLYTRDEVERLRLLGELTQAGHSIGTIARLSTERLAAMTKSPLRMPEPVTLTERGLTPAGPLVEECLNAVRQLDSRRLEEGLNRGAALLGAVGLLQRVVAPTVQAIGDLWRQGDLTTAHEHFATSALRVFLGNLAKPYGSVADAPGLVTATPAGQVHELGALLVAALASNLGWRVAHLGASLPAAEIAGAARQSHARAVALSVVYPEDDPRLDHEFRTLRQCLGRQVPVLVGGRAVEAYQEVLNEIGALSIPSLSDLGVALDHLRRPEKRNGQ